MPIPTKYRKGAAAIASYDWLDITAGLGYRRYYGCYSDDTSTYFLATEVIDAKPPYYTWTTTDGATT